MCAEDTKRKGKTRDTAKGFFICDESLENMCHVNRKHRARVQATHKQTGDRCAIFPQPGRQHTELERDSLHF